MLDKIVDFMLNYIFVSIPQSMLIILLVTLFIKEKEYFKKNLFGGNILQMLLEMSQRNIKLGKLIKDLLLLSKIISLSLSIIIKKVFISV